jgi:hypothetical protein
VDAESDTGLLLEVTLHQEATVDGVASEAEVLRFYVAVRVNAETDTWVLDEQLAGRPVGIAGIDLERDPYRLFVAQASGGEPQTVRAVAVAETEGRPVLWATLERPAEQTLMKGKIISRTLLLRPADQVPSLSWSETGCLLSEDGSIRFGSSEDQDCDGYRATAHGGLDCDDQDASINPAASDDHDCDGRDNDCDGVIDPGGDEDSDGDGYTPCQLDCDDGDPEISPGAEELCDGVDNNCNGKCDEGMDEDGDTFTPCKTMLVEGGKQCVRVPLADCDDLDPEVHPGAEEHCDGVDNDCNGLCDEGTDPDGDGYNDCGTLDPTIDPLPEETICLDPHPELRDCAPDDPAVHPFAPELCDGVDTDCNADTPAPETVCYAWLHEAGEDLCFRGSSGCSEGNGNASWGECISDTASSELEPQAYCAAWDLCKSEVQPDRCIGQKVDHFTLGCIVNIGDQGYQFCGEDPPTYYLPFGVGSQSGCTWYLQLDYNDPAWPEVGLVDPSSPDEVLVTSLDACEAGLVARPQLGASPPNALTGTLSLVDLSAGSPVLLVIPFSIEAGAAGTCPTNEGSLSCTLYVPNPP